MTWKKIIKATYQERGNKYTHYANRDKPLEERDTGKTYEGILPEQVINDLAKDLGLPKGNYDFHDESAITAKLVMKGDTLEVEIGYGNLTVLEENTQKVIHKFKESDIEIENDFTIQVGENDLDFEVSQYHSGKLYVSIVNV